MCGINGFISSGTKNASFLKQKITAMNHLIIHRGPDDDGVYVHSNKSVGITMGMRRLSIIDLSTGKQPIFSKDKQVVIVFNGEIYNYRKLRNSLINKGVNFETQSDTEVILKLYEDEGVKAFKKLDGMYAFSIYDKRQNKVFIARDFFGEKPLYYRQTSEGFIWASELKSIIKTGVQRPIISKTGLNLYFRLTYIPAPFTIYDDIFKLEANHYIEYDINTHSFEILEIEPEKRLKKIDIPFKSARNEVKNLVRSSVISRSVSDVPIGTFLSGGVDSSIVSLCLSQMKEDKINTFSIGFEKKAFDESDKARTVAKLINSNHHEFVLNEKDLENNVSKILLNFDEPFADSSSLPSYLVANKTSQHVKVALTGDGGDEIFGGYNKYYIGKINQRYTKLIPENVHKIIKKVGLSLLHSKDDSRGFSFRMKRLLNAIDYSESYYWDIISLGFSGNTLSDYLLPEFFERQAFGSIKAKTGIDYATTLTDFRMIDKYVSLEGDMLVKVDRSSMLTSLECRAPFLNKALWNYTNSLPENYLIKGWDKKFILKDAFRDEFPDGFLDKSKSGFGVPVGDWLRSSLKDRLLEFIEDGFLKKQGIFEPKAIQNLVMNHINGKDHTFMVWSFFCFQNWYCNN